MSMLLCSYLRSHFGPKVNANIVFEKTTKVFYPGEKVRGVISLTVLHLRSFEGN